ncbi:MAG: Rieske 2Fe-2S domain-containing protein [Nitrospira sp.]|nr:Rieske 2Fe-2S domain-containing protein [Nitrospira sp.]
MEGFQLVARAEEIPVGGAKVVEVNAREIALFNVNGTFYAIYNICPHQGGPLGEGRLKGHVVSCPWHDLAFDVRSGLATDGGGNCVGSYQVLVNDGEVFVGPRRKVQD